MEELTRRQRQILEFIKASTRERGYPPSVREIGEAVGLKSTSTVHTYLERLERKGYIRRDPTKPRAIEVLDEAGIRTRTVPVPLVGQVTAGQPILAVE
ncbi:MAG TPA: transcriptional repressor LexA, partial [Thermaerobacter sp.]